MVNWKILKETPYAPLAKHSRVLAAEGCVLLKNENNLLPIGKKIQYHFSAELRLIILKAVQVQEVL